MGKEKMLSMHEKRRIGQLKRNNCSIHQISKEVKRSRKLISKYISNTVAYGTQKSSGRPKALKARTVKSMVRKASNKVISCRTIKSTLNMLKCKANYH